MDGIGGLEGWRWIFILEGLATVIVAVGAFFLLFDFPETAPFLTEEERSFVLLRLRLQGQVKLASDPESRAEEPAIEAAAYGEHFSWTYVKQAFIDWQVWVSIVLYWGVSLLPTAIPRHRSTPQLTFSQVVCPIYGISLFLPTIIKHLNYTSSEAQLLTIPMYITAAILAVAGAFAADKYRKRSLFLFICLAFMLLGFTMCVHSPYFGSWPI